MSPPQQGLDLPKLLILSGFALIFWVLAALFLRLGCSLYNRLARVAPEPSVQDMLTKGRPPVDSKLHPGVNEPTLGHALLITLAMASTSFITLGLDIWARWGLTIERHLFVYSPYVLSPIQFLLSSVAIKLFLPTTYRRALAINFLTSALIIGLAAAILALVYVLGVRLSDFRT